MRVIVVLLSMSIALAHSGFNQLSWQESLGAYQLSILEDFHVAENTAQVFVQVSQGNAAAPEDTKVNAAIKHKGELIYDGELAFIANSQVDKQAYAGYVLDTAISEEGLYQLELSLSGPLGDVSKTYFVQAKNENRISALEYLPSALILLITLGGALLLFIPLPKRKVVDHEENSESPHHQFSNAQ